MRLGRAVKNVAHRAVDQHRHVSYSVIPDISQGDTHGEGCLTYDKRSATLVSTLEGMSVVPAQTVILGDRFARELAEMALPWQAEKATDPRLLVLNEPLAVELGLDPEWLRSPEGLRLLVGNLVPEGARPVAQA